LRRPQFRTPTDAESSARLYHAVYTRDVQQGRGRGQFPFAPSSRKFSFSFLWKLSPLCLFPIVFSEMGREPLFPQILRSRGRRSTTRAHRVR
jgi:hypothetical protein